MNEPTATASTNTTNAGDATTTENNAAVNTATADANAQTTATEATTTEANKAQAATPEVPETYEFTMPEGMQVDQAAATEFATIAKELKLSAADAQKVADVGAKMAQRQAEAHAATVESWIEQVKTDKELGGDKLPENLAIARKAVEAFGTPELKEILDSTGFGNHPAIIRAFHKIGKAISQDGFVTGTAKGADTDKAKRMFPTMN